MEKIYVKTSLVNIEQMIRYHLPREKPIKSVKHPISVGIVPVRSFPTKIIVNNEAHRYVLEKQWKDECVKY